MDIKYLQQLEEQRRSTNDKQLQQAIDHKLNKTYTAVDNEKSFREDMSKFVNDTSIPTVIGQNGTMIYHKLNQIYWTVTIPLMLSSLKNKIVDMKSDDINSFIDKIFELSIVKQYFPNGRKTFSKFAIENATTDDTKIVFSYKPVTEKNHQEYTDCGSASWDAFFIESLIHSTKILEII